jgi:hypothetical protein
VLLFLFICLKGTPASLLTPQAEEIYEWLIKKGNSGKAWGSQDLSKRFKPDPSEDLFWRLRLLRDHRITIERESYWNFRVFVSESPAPELTLLPLNPVFPDVPKEFAKIDLERLRDFFENLILDHETKGNILLVACADPRTNEIAVQAVATRFGVSRSTIYENNLG